MKTSLKTIFILLLILPVGQLAVAAEKVVQLEVPGCRNWGAAERIGSILKTVEGVSKVDFPGGEIVSITIDDAKTSIPAITEALKNGGYSAKQMMETPSDGK